VIRAPIAIFTSSVVAMSTLCACFDIDALRAGTQCPDAGVVAPSLPGSKCRCDIGCAGGATHEGVCVAGVCMQRPSGACSIGAIGPCGAGTRCWQRAADEDWLCVPECLSFACAGVCEGTVCTPYVEGRCDPECASYCDTPPTVCP